MTNSTNEAMRAEFEDIFCPDSKDRKNWMRRIRNGDYSNAGMQSAWQGFQAARASLAIPSCSCKTCLPNTFSNMRMVLCQICGNTRCPHAKDHHNACTGSNEPGQPGISYPAPAIPQADHDKQTGISLAARKTAHVMSQGYQIVGHVLRKRGGDYALSAEGAVRWLKQAEYWKLMHGPFDSKITASLSRNMSGDDLLVLSTGQTFLMKDLPGWNAAREVDNCDRHDAERWRMHLSMMSKNGHSIKAICETIDAVNAQITAKEKS